MVPENMPTMLSGTQEKKDSYIPIMETIENVIERCCTVQHLGGRDSKITSLRPDWFT
jgi:hypothetical protein